MVWVGVTETEPVFGSTLPTPGVMVAEVALSITQLRVEAWPGWIEAGFAVNWTMRTAAGRRGRNRGRRAGLEAVGVADRQPERVGLAGGRRKRRVAGGSWRG